METAAKLNITVAKNSDWEYLKSISTDILESVNLGNYTAEKFFSVPGTTLVHEFSVGPDEYALENFAKEVSSRLKTSCVFLAATTCFDTDPGTSLIYYFGDKVHFEPYSCMDEYDDDEDDDECDDDEYDDDEEDNDEEVDTSNYILWQFYEKMDISQLNECIKFCKTDSRFSLSDKEEKTLKELGIL